MLELLNSESVEETATEIDASADNDTCACDAFQVCGCMCARQQIYVPGPV